MAHNVESQIWQRYFETESNPFRRWYIKQQWQKYVRYETAVVSQATRVAAVSADDASLLKEALGAREVDVVENGVDLTYYQPQAMERRAGSILFLGSLDWRPNLDAVKILLEHIFPKVRAEEPCAQLCLVGRSPPEWLRRVVAKAPQVQLFADVADVRPFLAQCQVMAVPLRIAGGSRLKILEALASGLPVVSTQVGAEGLGLKPGRHLIVVDDIGGMVSALLGALRDPAQGMTLAARGRHFVVGHYGWDALADKLERAWFRCVEPASESNPASVPVRGNSKAA
jgi:glycosyltransferase involved in cell wall biosynthesis